MATGTKVTLRDLPTTVRQAAPAAAVRVGRIDEGAGPLDLHATEKRLIAQALTATKGNITAAAKKLGISRRTLHRKLNEMKEAQFEIRSAKSETLNEIPPSPDEARLSNPNEENPKPK